MGVESRPDMCVKMEAREYCTGACIKKSGFFFFVLVCYLNKYSPIN